MPVSQRPRARRGSMPVAGWQRQRLGHADRIRIMEHARRLERGTYRRGRGLHGGCLRQTGLRVLWFLLYRGQGSAGATDPALQQIADGLQVARSTVQLALARLEAAGVLAVVPRGRVRGGRFEQVTNAYLLRAVAAWRSDTDLRQALDSIIKQLEIEHAPTGDVLNLQGLVEKWGLD
jgi:predicted transcriptional regulator